MTNPRHFLKLSDFTATELRGLVHRAQQMKRRRDASQPVPGTPTKPQTF
jgi:ornithine carbamoyltransferase